MKKTILLIIAIFLFTPYLLDKYMMGKVVTTMGKAEWFGFLGSYLGGGITALITLIGIYWQLNETKKKSEKENKEGIFEYLKYILNKNQNIEFKYQILRDSETTYKVKKDKLFFSFGDSFIEGNAKIIFSEKKGKEIASLFESVNNYNKTYVSYIEDYIELKNRIDKIIQIFIESELPSETKDEFVRLILKGRDLILYLNMQQGLIESYLIMGPRIYEGVINGLSVSIKRELSEFFLFLNSIEETPIINELDMTTDYNNLMKIQTLNANTFTKDDFEEYLIKLFSLEKQIFALSTMYLVSEFLTPNSTINFIKEQSKIYEYFEKKLSLLNEKNEIINETNILIEEIQKILNKLSK